MGGIEDICRKSSEVTLLGAFNLTLPPGGIAVEWLQSGKAVSIPWTNMCGLSSLLGLSLLAAEPAANKRCIVRITVTSLKRQVFGPHVCLGNNWVKMSVVS